MAPAESPQSGTTPSAQQRGYASEAGGLQGQGCVQRGGASEAGSIQRLIAVAARLAHSLVPSALFVPNLAAATTPAPAPVSAALFKACDKDSRRAADLATRLAQLNLPAEKRPEVEASLCRLIKSSYRDSSILEALDLIQKQPDHSRQVECFTRLATLSTPSQGRVDLELAHAMVSELGVSLEDAVPPLLALRKADPGRKDDYPTYNDLSNSLRYVLEPKGNAERARRLATLATCQKGGRTPSRALPFALALEGLACDDAQRSQVTDKLHSMLGRYKGPNQDSALVDAVRGVSGPEAAARFRVFEIFLDECRSPQQALADFRLADATIAASGAESAGAASAGLQEVADHILALRQAEPSRRESYRSFSDLGKVLEHVMSGGDPATRSQAREHLVALQCGRRHAVERVLDLDRLLGGLEVPGPQRDAMRPTLIHMLDHAGTHDLATLQDALRLLDGKADAAERLAALDRMARMDRWQFQPALDDYKLADDAATRHGQPFAQVATRLLELRKEDPNRTSDYPSFANLQAPLDQVLAHGGDQARDLLQDLQVNGRTPQQATPHASRLQQLPCSSEDRAVITAGYRKALKRHGTQEDKTFLATLDRIGASQAELRERFDAWQQLLGLCRRPSQALADLDLAIRAAQETGRSFGDAATMLIALRKADPGRRYEYPAFSDVSSPLLGALRTQAPPGRRAEELAALQVRGRTPAQAFEHDQRLLALPCDATQKTQVRAEYQALLRKSSTGDDVDLRSLLDILATRPAPLDDLRAFGRILARTQRTEAALIDFRAAVTASTRSKVPMEEMVDHVVALRQCDACCRRDYPTFAPLDDALAFIADSGADSASRLAERQQVTGFMTLERSVAKALHHAKALRSTNLPPDQRGAVAELHRALVKSSTDDAAIRELLTLVDGTADPRARMEEMVALYKASTERASQVVVDYRVILDLQAKNPSVSRAEMVEHVVKARRADPRREHGGFTALGNALPLVMEAATPEARAERRESYMHLLEAAGGDQEATQELTWLLNTPGAGEDLATRTRKMTRLQKRMPFREEETLGVLYRQVQGSVQQDPQGGLARLLRMPRTFERIALRLLSKERDAQAVAALMESLEQGRFEGESYRSAYGRLKLLLKQGPVGRQARILADAFEGVVTAGPKLGATPQERWQRFKGILREHDAAIRSATVWRSMARATTAQEAEARHEAFRRLLESRKNPDDAVTIFRAVTDDLEPGEAVNSGLPTMLELCESSRVDTAAHSYHVLRGMRNLSPAEHKILTRLFAQASWPQEVDLLQQVATTPLGQETLEQRATMLNTLMSMAKGATSCAQDFHTVADAVGKDLFADLGPGVATVANLLRRNGRSNDVAEACQILDWARKQEFEGDPDLPLAEAMAELGSHMLLSGDAEAAKTATLNARAQRRRMRLAQEPAGAVKVGSDEIMLGGVRIKVRRGEE